MTTLLSLALAASLWANPRTAPVPAAEIAPGLPGSAGAAVQPAVLPVLGLGGSPSIAVGFGPVLSVAPAALPSPVIAAPAAAAAAAPISEPAAPARGALGAVSRRLGAAARPEPAAGWRGSDPAEADAGARNDALFDGASARRAPGEAVDAAAPRGAVPGALEASAAPVGGFARILEENPDLAPMVQGRLERMGLAPAMPQGWWQRQLPVLFEPFAELRRRQRRMASPAAYAQFLAGGSEEAKSERDGLAELLRRNTEHRAEAWTYIFRDHPLWKEPLEAFLDKKIRDRRAERRLELDSVGTGYGSEAYSLAIVVHEALARAGEDPAAWDVRIRTQDKSLASLLAAKRGLYRPGERDRETFDALGLASRFEPADGGLLRLKEPMRGWIRPAYMDLDDPAQLPLLPARSDVIFANYLLFHLRLDPAATLADRWLGGEWADHGFLSMAQVLVAEVGASARAPAKFSVLSSYEGNVGWAGYAFYGDSLRTPGGVRWALSELWRRKTSRTARKVLEDGRRSAYALARDARSPVDADGAMAERIAAAARQAGLEPRLTTDSVLMRADPESGQLYLNIGWVAPSKGPERSREFDRLLAAELKGLPPAAARAPPPAAALEHPELGRGELILTGRMVGGPFLKLGRFGGRAALYWLTSRLVPISAAYKGDNAAKSEERQESDARQSGASRPSGPRMVRGLY